MRIALIHNQFIRAGGMERYLFDLVTGFADAGHEVTVICFKAEEPQPLLDKCRMIRFEFTLVPKPLRRYAFDRAVRKTLRQQPFDLTIALPEIQNVDIAICGGTHQAFLSHLQLSPGRFDRSHIKLETKSYRSAKTVVAHSPMLKEELRRLYGIPESQIEVILPPTDSQTFQRVSEQQRAEYQRRFEIRESVTTILLCSTGHHRKGLGPLLEALKALPADEFELLVAGRKVEELTQPGAPSNVRGLGYIKDIAALYNAVDVTALPALYEPFGLVVVESLQCGTPVLLSGAVGAGTLVSDCDGVIVDPLSPQTIAEGLRGLRDNPKQVTADFADAHGLSAEAHIQSLLELHQRKHLSA
jgi:glycosyltransferase involved in cell wall biosynthesis